MYPKKPQQSLNKKEEEIHEEENLTSSIKIVHDNGQFITIREVSMILIIMRFINDVLNNVLNLSEDVSYLKGMDVVEINSNWLFEQITTVLSHYDIPFDVEEKSDNSTIQPESVTKNEEKCINKEEIIQDKNNKDEKSKVTNTENKNIEHIHEISILVEKKSVKDDEDEREIVILNKITLSNKIESLAKFIDIIKKHFLNLDQIKKDFKSLRIEFPNEWPIMFKPTETNIVALCKFYETLFNLLIREKKGLLNLMNCVNQVCQNVDTRKKNQFKSNVKFIKEIIGYISILCINITSEMLKIKYEISISDNCKNIFTSINNTLESLILSLIEVDL